MKGLLRSFAIGLVVLVAAWGLGRLLLEVQLPDRTGRRDAFPDPLEERVSLLEAFRSLPAEGVEETRVILLDDNLRAWLERWRLLASAEQRLDICYFILKQDLFGLSFLGHLVQKAGEGVEIRVLLDAMGTDMSRHPQGNDYLDTLVNTRQIQVRMYRPLFFRYLDAFLTLNPAAVLVSDHDKILLADGRRALVGGRNISAEYFTPLDADPRAFRDTDAVLHGPGVGRALERSFAAQYGSGEAHDVRREMADLKNSAVELLLAYRVMDAWLRGEEIAAEDREAVAEGGFDWLETLRSMPELRGALGRDRPEGFFGEVRMVDSRCRLLAADDYLTRSLIRLTESAREEIFIQSPYLVLPDEAVDVLAKAAARGVAITILTNSPLSSDNPMSQGVFLEQWPELLARVPDLRLCVAGDRHNLHGKVAVFDRRLSLIGTYNLDPLSMAMNSELMAAAWSEELAGELLRSREALIAAGAPGIVRYRIGREPEGAPLRDGEGRVVTAFGPEDHLQPDQLEKAERYRRLYRVVRWLRGGSPFL